LLFVCGKVYVLGFEIVVDDNLTILLEIAFQTVFFYHTKQFGWRDILPTPGEVLEDQFGQGQQGRVGSIAGLAAATEGGQRGKFQLQSAVTMERCLTGLLDEAGEGGEAGRAGGL